MKKAQTTASLCFMAEAALISKLAAAIVPEVKANTCHHDIRSSSILKHMVCKPNADRMTRNVVTNLIVTTIRTNMSERPLPLPPFPPLPLLLPPSGQSLASSTMRMHSPEVVDDYEKMWSSAHQNPIPGPRRSGLLHSWSTRWTYPGNKKTNMNGNGNFYNSLNTRTTKFTL